MALELILATSGPCAGHLCDNCRRCKRGECCGRDLPTYRLPALGDWGGMVYGELGVLDDDGTTVGCHCCGGRFRLLGRHIESAHNLTVEEYRAIFGLNAGHPLAAEATRAVLRNLHGDRLKGYEQAVNPLTLQTPEQRLLITRKPRRYEVARRNAEKAQIIACAECGTPVHILPKQRESARYCSTACKWAAWRRRRDERIVEKPCAVCGTILRLPPHAARRRETCGGSCRSKYGRRDDPVALVACARCGKHTRKRPSKSHGTRFCSVACRAAAGRGARQARIVPAFITCAHCGKEQRVKPSEAARGRVHCSRACKTAAARELRTAHAEGSLR